MSFLVDDVWRTRLGLVLIYLACGCANVRTHTSQPDVLPILTAEELFQVAMFQAQRGDLFRAEQYLVAARNHGYDDTTATYWLVRVCVSAGRYHSALRHAQVHLDRNPSDWHLRLVVASIHEALGELEKARRQYQALTPVGVRSNEVQAALDRLSSLEREEADPDRSEP